MGNGKEWGMGNDKDWGLGIMSKMRSTELLTLST